jgi:hypothetical protein
MPNASSVRRATASQGTKKTISRIDGHFIEPMLLLRTEALPDDPSLWRYEIKHDGTAQSRSKREESSISGPGTIMTSFPVIRLIASRLVAACHVKELRPF